jgi:hypothetical protein
VRDNGSASMQLGHRAQIDGEGQLDLLTLPQSEIRGFDEDAGGAQVHGAAQLAAATWNIDVDGGPSPMPGMETAFH